MRIAFIGLGEAGSAIISGWGAPRAGQVSAFDIKLEDGGAAGEIRDRAAALGIVCAESLPALLSGAAIAFSTVTADQAVAAATAAAPHLERGTIWCDLNSCAPSSKRRAAAIVEAAGGRYVDVAVMAPVHPRRNLVPLLVSGPHAAAVAPILESLPMAPRVVEGDVGRASAIKMIRSVMVKGLEALTAECALAAAEAGVEDEVFGSLARSGDGADWRPKTAYNMERMLRHGTRRAAEMEEVAQTLRDLGLPDDMALATVRWQRRMADSGVAPPEGEPDLAGLTAALLEALKR